MNPERYQRIDEVFQQALSQPPERVKGFLDEACSGDPELRREVESLLGHDRQTESFINAPLIPLEDASGIVVVHEDYTGRTLSRYRIFEKLGEGGMGVVYKAHDTRLNRTVSLKLLPLGQFANPERKRRFIREARAASALNHPNIVTIHDIDQADGVDFIAMEFIAGQTLDREIPAKGMPFNRVLEIGVQMADAMAAAHAAGIIHRDLKPSNVMLSESGQVKILDFGLAKVVEREMHGPGGDPGSSETEPSLCTEKGMILGTSTYMSPEQARGEAVDQRTDIWAFGCILYECLTGKSAFAGKTISDTVALILRGEPDWEALPAVTPQRLRELLNRCLEKDSRRRLHHFADVRIDLENALNGTVVKVRKHRRAQKIVLTATGLIVIALAAILMLRWRSPAREPGPLPTRMLVTLSPDKSFTLNGGIDISPDGRMLAFGGGTPEKSGLYIRRVDEWEPHFIPGTEGGFGPLFSPDGRWIAFNRNNQLEKTPVLGGPPQTICRYVPSQDCSYQWDGDGAILFATWPETAIWRVSADGGTPETLLRATEGNEMWYQMPIRLPGSSAILFTKMYRWEKSIVAFLPGSSTPRTIVKPGAFPRYLPSGHLVYSAQSHLMAAPFDLKRVELKSAGTVVIDDIAEGANPVSDNGTLLYISKNQTLSRLVWKHRKGLTTPLGFAPRRYRVPDLSPDGRRLVVTVWEGDTRNDWIAGVDGEPLTRLTFGNNDWRALFTPDGRRVTFGAGAGGQYNIFWTAADGSGKAERLTNSPYPQQPTSWSPNGEVLLFHDWEPETKTDIWQLYIKTMEVRPFLQTRFFEEAAVFSPDGRWIAYHSDLSEKSEVYVQAYPGPGPKIQVSVGGGETPEWNRNGREIFYMGPDHYMAVPVQLGETISAGTPVRLFDTKGGIDYPHASPDGQRFLTDEPVEGAGAPLKIHLVQNWFTELQRLAPIDGK